MQLSFIIHSRPELIAFGTAFGIFIADKDRHKTRMLACGGDNNSGKSFLSLCIDRVLDPNRYPDGLPDSISADYMLNAFHAAHYKGSARTERLKTVFRNFSVQKQPFTDLDKSLAKLRSTYTHARVIVVSNPDRDNEGFDYEKNGLSSAQLDLHIHFKILPGSFVRKLTVTFDDPDFLPLFAPFLGDILSRPQGSLAYRPQPI